MPPIKNDNRERSDKEKADLLQTAERKYLFIPLPCQITD